MRTTSRRTERVRFQDVDALAAEWPRLLDRDAVREPHAEPEPRRRIGARWDMPDEGKESDGDASNYEPHRPRRKKRMRWIAVIVLIVVAALLAGTLAIAQQAGKVRPEVAAAAPAAAAGDEATITERAVMGDWVYGCVRQQTGSKLCFIRQQLSDSTTKTPIFTWTVGQDAKGDLVAVWQTPTGVLIGQGMLFDIGMEKPIPVPYRACTRGQCQAVANLAPDFVERLAKAEKARATIVAATGNGLAFDFSVQGLAEGLAALRKK